MSSYFRALSFLTVVPLPFVRFGLDGKELTDSATCFPLAGATLGLFLAFPAWLLSFAFPPAPVAATALILSFLLTRGLHFDGLADTADGLIGTTNREKALKAMEDSAIGVMGAASLFFVYLLKFAFLSELEISGYLLPAALFFMPLAGRWAIVYGGAWFAPARNRGLGDLFLRGLRWPVLLKASLGALLLIAPVGWWLPQLLYPVLGGCLAALLSAHLLAFYAAKRLGGLTGDILGASCELGEMFFLAGFYLAFYFTGLSAGGSKVVSLLV
ncbi:MAG: adenosylcobinamide-GDP ribazoletransferase [Bacillota bacterium]